NPLTATRRVVASPATRAAFPRTSSNKSGFFFCGIALLPGEYASGKWTNPNSWEEKMIISSAQRLRCKESSVSAFTNSRTKSRSLWASTLLLVTASRPTSTGKRRYWLAHQGANQALSARLGRGQCAACNPRRQSSRPIFSRQNDAPPPPHHHRGTLGTSQPVQQFDRRLVGWKSLHLK